MKTKKVCKVFLLAALSIVLVISLIGCSNGAIKLPVKNNSKPLKPPQNDSINPTNGGEAKEYNGVTAKVLNTDHPVEIESYLQENQAKETQQAFNINNRTYIVLTMGEKTSGGYTIKLKDLVLGDGTLKVFVKYIKPGKDDITTTVMTYPSLVIETDKIYEGHYDIVYDIEK